MNAYDVATEFECAFRGKLNFDHRSRKWSTYEHGLKTYDHTGRTKHLIMEFCVARGRTSPGFWRQVETIVVNMPSIALWCQKTQNELDREAAAFQMTSQRR